MLFYPILDISRGVVFTLGGLTQLRKETREESDGSEYPREFPLEVYPIISIWRWDYERLLF
jgi:hypothetical protein